MVARMQKHRMRHWLGMVFVVLSLVSSCGAQAVLFLPKSYLYRICFPDVGCTAQVSAVNHYDACHQLNATYDLKPGYIDEVTIYTNSWNCGVPESPVSFWRDLVVFVSPICPEHSIYNPDYKIFCGCVAPYVLDQAQTSCVPKSLIITLSGGTEVEPTNGSDKKFLPIIATVLDQSTNKPSTNPVKVHVSLRVEDPKSGGHDHGDSTRPRGGIAEVETCASDAECWPGPQSTAGKGMTDSNGQVVFNFNAPEASGKYTISATCDGCSNTATKLVNVKVDGLKPIPAVPLFYALNETNGDVIGAKIGWHTDNHNLTHAAAQKLIVIALLYRTLPQFKVVVDKKTGKKDFPPVLHINDASLPWGGVLDFDAEAEWNAPHKEHRRGTVVDIRANSKPGAIPTGNFESFIWLAKLHKVHAKLHSEGQTNQHFHVRLLNRSE